MGLNWGRVDEAPLYEDEPDGPLTRAELQDFMEKVKHAAYLGDKIHRKFAKTLDERDHFYTQQRTNFGLINELNGEITKLNKEKEKLSQKNKVLKQQNQGFQEYLGKHTEKLQEFHEIKEKNNELEKKVKEIERKRLDEQAVHAKAQQDLKKLKKIIDPIKEMDRKSQVVAAGEITHDSVASNFKEIFNERRVLEPLNITDSTQRQMFLTSLFKSAYEMCADQIIDTCSVELRKLHTAPTRSLTVEDSGEEFSTMRSRLDAYSYLVSISGAKEQPPPSFIIEKLMDFILKQHLTKEMNKEKAVSVVQRVVENCWKMVQLTPPMTMSLQPSCDEEHFERKRLKGQNDDLEFEDLLQLPNSKLQLLRPTLFFSPNGTYWSKGSVAVMEAIDGSGTVSILKEQNECILLPLKGKAEANPKSFSEDIGEELSLSFDGNTIPFNASASKVKQNVASEGHVNKPGSVSCEMESHPLDCATSMVPDLPTTFFPGLDQACKDGERFLVQDLSMKHKDNSENTDHLTNEFQATVLAECLKQKEEDSSKSKRNKKKKKEQDQGERELDKKQQETSSDVADHDNYKISSEFYGAPCYLRSSNQ